MNLKKRRKIRDRQDAEKCLKKWRKSGLSMSEWAAENRVDGRSLNAWLQSMKRQADVERGKRAGLVELVLPEKTKAAEFQPFVVKVGEYEVEVPPSFDDAALLRLLSVVRSAC